MLERYTEKALWVIFLARYEASRFGSPYIETEHLLLGLLREDKALANRFLRSHAAVESIRKQIEGHTTIREKVSTSVDLPLSHECKRVLAYGAEEAERLNHTHIGTEHLLLGLLREKKCFAAEILLERGLRLSTIRKELARSQSEKVASARPKVPALREPVVPLENQLVMQKLYGRLPILAEAPRLKGSGRPTPRWSGEDRFWFLMDSAPVMVRMTSGDGLCQYFNRAWLEFRGRTMEQELGNGWAEGLHPDDHDLCMETYLKSFSARQPYRLEYRLRRRDGEYRWVEDTGVPRFEEDGTFAGFIISTMDVSTRKRGIFTPDEEAVRKVVPLTERERQVLVLIVEGKSTKEAAVHLGISYKTADWHRSRILEKLGVHETAGMVRYAIRSGLIVP